MSRDLHVVFGAGQIGTPLVYHCMNPAYSAKEWARELPRYAAALAAAAGRAKARLVVLDNVYMLGRPGGRALDEDSPIAHARGDARVVVGRASDFYGPGGTGTYFGEVFWPKALASGTAQALMRLDTPHTYHYTLDVAAGLAALGEAPDDVTGRWWMLPALGLFVPILRELREMGYQWDEPFVVNDARFRARFPLVPTTLDTGVAAMTEWARRHYAAKILPFQRAEAI
jgi:hypothetical protein